MTNMRRYELLALLIAASAAPACVDEDAVPPPAAAAPGAPHAATSPAAPASASASESATATATAQGAPAAPQNAPAMVAATAPSTAITPSDKPAPAASATGTGSVSGQVTATPAKLGQHVVVYLQNAPLRTDLPATTIDQRQMTFSPFITIVPMGAKVMFHNSDPFPHNVFSPNGERFNLGTMGQSSVRYHVFTKPGPYTLLCNVHPGMLGYIYVVPSSYYGMADKDGKFTIKDVPNGTYTLAAWAPKLAESTQSVTVAGGEVVANLELHRGN